MTKDFEVIDLAENLEYNYLVVLCKSESPYEFLDGIAHSLNSQIGDCKILIDEILHVGNTEKRYMEFSLIDGKLVDGKFDTGAQHPDPVRKHYPKAPSRGRR